VNDYDDFYVSINLSYCVDAYGDFYFSINLSFVSMPMMPMMIFIFLLIRALCH
jgi:hypothetical protein